MDNHEKLRLRDPEVTPTSELLEQTLGDSYGIPDSNSRLHKAGWPLKPNKDENFVIDNLISIVDQLEKR